MKALKIILIVLMLLVAVVAVILGWATTVSGSGSFEKSITINKAPHLVYEEIINMKKYDQWNYWYTLDPEAFTYEGPEEGIGSISLWDSENSDLGKGSNEIVEFDLNKRVKTKLDFGFSGDFHGELTLTENDGKTEVNWLYTYDNLDIIGKAFTGMMDMEAELGPAFEQGLAKLKAVVEVKADPVPVQLPEPVVLSDSLEVETVEAE